MSSKTGASEIGAILEAQKSPAEFSNYAQDVFMKNSQKCRSTQRESASEGHM